MQQRADSNFDLENKKKAWKEALLRKPFVRDAINDELQTNPELKDTFLAFVQTKEMLQECLMTDGKVSLFLDRLGVDFNRPFADAGSSWVHFFAEHPDKTRAADRLKFLFQGLGNNQAAPITAMNLDGDTALHVALRRNVEIAKLIIEKGIGCSIRDQHGNEFSLFNVQNPKGETPISIAQTIAYDLGKEMAMLVAPEAQQQNISVEVLNLIKKIKLAILRRQLNKAGSLIRELQKADRTNQCIPDLAIFTMETADELDFILPHAPKIKFIEYYFRCKIKQGGQSISALQCPAASGMTPLEYAKSKIPRTELYHALKQAIEYSSLCAIDTDLLQDELKRYENQTPEDRAAYAAQIAEQKKREADYAAALSSQISSGTTSQSTEVVHPEPNVSEGSTLIAQTKTLGEHPVSQATSDYSKRQLIYPYRKFSYFILLASAIPAAAAIISIVNLVQPITLLAAINPPLGLMIATLALATVLTALCLIATFKLYSVSSLKPAESMQSDPKNSPILSLASKGA